MAGWSVRQLVPCRALSDGAARRQVYEEELQRQAAQHEARKRARYGASHQHRPFSGGVPFPLPLLHLIYHTVPVPNQPGCERTWVELGKPAASRSSVSCF